MRVDLRLPIGLMFAVLGLLLTAFGALGDPAIYRRSLDVNVNLWWGLVLFAFGVAFVAAARRAGPGE